MHEPAIDGGVVVVGGVVAVGLRDVISMWKQADSREGPLIQL